MTQTDIETKIIESDTQNNLSILEPVAATEFVFNTVEPDIFKNNTIVFYNQKEEHIKFCKDGEIYLKGRLAGTDKEVVDAMREFLSQLGFIKPVIDADTRASQVNENMSATLRTWLTRKGMSVFELSSLGKSDDELESMIMGTYDFDLETISKLEVIFDTPFIQIAE